MDKYPYRNQYPPYPYPHGYPPPPNQDPYPPPPYQPPYNSPQFAYPPLPTSQSPPPLSYSHSHSMSLSGAIPSQHPFPVSPNPPPRPILHHHSSFQYDPSNFPYQQPEIHSPISSPGPPSRQDSFSRHNRQESTSPLGANTNSTPYVPLAYPPLAEILSNVQLSDSPPTTPASTPTPSVPPLSSATSTPELQIPVYGNATAGNVYPYPKGCFGRIGSCHQPVLPHVGILSKALCGPSLQMVPSQKGSLRVLLLHGNLDIWVCDAVNLPNMDVFHKTLGDMIVMIPANMTNIIEGRKNDKVTSDPYVTIAVADAVVGRTYVINNNENPVWMQHFNVPAAHYAAEVHFIVKDSDVVGSQLIGIVAIPVEQIYTGVR